MCGILGHQQGGRGRTRRAGYCCRLWTPPCSLPSLCARHTCYMHCPRGPWPTPQRSHCVNSMLGFSAPCPLPQPDHRQAALPRQFVAVPALSACLAHHTQASQPGTQPASPERNVGGRVRVAWLCGDMVEGHADEQRYFLASPWPIRLRSWNNEHSYTQKKV